MLDQPLLCCSDGFRKPEEAWLIWEEATLPYTVQ